MRTAWRLGLALGLAVTGCEASVSEPAPAAPPIRATADIDATVPVAVAEESPMTPTAAAAVRNLDEAVPAELTTATFALG